MTDSEIYTLTEGVVADMLHLGYDLAQYRCKWSDFYRNHVYRCFGDTRTKSVEKAVRHLRELLDVRCDLDSAICGTKDVDIDGHGCKMIDLRGTKFETMQGKRVFRPGLQHPTGVFYGEMEDAKFKEKWWRSANLYPKKLKPLPRKLDAEGLKALQGLLYSKEDGLGADVMIQRIDGLAKRCYDARKFRAEWYTCKDRYRKSMRNLKKSLRVLTSALIRLPRTS